jgi:SAM-dependent methyltransferase
MRRCVACGSVGDAPNWQCGSCNYAPQREMSYTSFVANGDVEDDGFEAKFFARLAELESGFWWFEARNALISWALGKYFPGAASFLEIGCGTGFVIATIAREFPGLRTSASEIYREGIEIVAARSPSTTCYQLDARNLPFREEFDVIGAFDVIEHIDDDYGAVAEMRSAVLPNGGLILTVPQHGFLWSAADEFAHHKRRYSRRALRAVLEEAGFTIIAMRSFVSLLMPALLMSRLKHRRVESFDPNAEFAIGAAANRTLSLIMKLESMLIRAGVSFPFGGSLVAIARRT